MMSVHPLETAEGALLMECLKPPARQDPARLSSLADAPGLRPELALQRAAEHGAAGFMQRALRQVPGAGPVSLREGIDAMATLVRMRNMKLATDLGEVMGALQGAGVRALTFKGPTTSLQLHGDVGIRPSNDLDVLVPPDALNEAMRLVTGLGFRRDPKFDLRDMEPNLAHHIAYLRGGTTLEVHVRLFSNAGFANESFDVLWPGRRPCTIPGGPVATLDVGRQALHLALHGSWHGFGCLKWLADIGALLNDSAEISWTDLLEDAEHSEWRRPLLLALHLASEALELPLSPAVEERVTADKRFLDRKASTCVRRWFPEEAPVDRRTLEGVFFRLGLLESANVLRELKRLLFRPNSADWNMLPFLSPRTPVVFSIIRPLRIVFRYTGAAAQLAWRRLFPKSTPS
jgi:Uncharacterised nucleotidyltransferase